MRTQTNWNVKGAEASITVILILVTPKLVSWIKWPQSARPDLQFHWETKPSEGSGLIRRNKKINFLPEKVADTFQNLLAYLASNCSLTEVSKINFEKLHENIRAYGNKIEKIASNTFEGLTALAYFYLCKRFRFLINLINLNLFSDVGSNRIKSINGVAFQNLKMLTTVQLVGNVCNDENFENQTTIVVMPMIVTQKCGFDENILM